MDLSSLLKDCEICHGTGHVMSNKKFYSCFTCKAGKVLTDAGYELLRFIKVYGDFAESDHTHTIN